MDVGSKVCVVGVGIDNVVHYHTKIVRVTKTMLITEDGRRFSSASSHHSLPRSDWGGRCVEQYCQRPGRTDRRG